MTTCRRRDPFVAQLALSLWRALWFGFPHERRGFSIWDHGQGREFLNLSVRLTDRVILRWRTSRGYGM